MAKSTDKPLGTEQDPEKRAEKAQAGAEEIAKNLNLSDEAKGKVAQSLSNQLDPNAHDRTAEELKSDVENLPMFDQFGSPAGRVPAAPPDPDAMARELAAAMGMTPAQAEEARLAAEKKLEEDAKNRETPAQAKKRQAKLAEDLSSGKDYQVNPEFADTIGEMLKPLQRHIVKWRYNETTNITTVVYGPDGQKLHYQGEALRAVPQAVAAE